jgi:hypothetical protein
MASTPCSTPAVLFPGNFVLSRAQLCAMLVNTAYDQFAQWGQQHYPKPANFRYTFAMNNPQQPQGPLTVQPNVVTGRGIAPAVIPAAVTPVS